MDSIIWKTRKKKSVVKIFLHYFKKHVYLKVFNLLLVGKIKLFKQL